MDEAVDFNLRAFTTQQGSSRFKTQAPYRVSETSFHQSTPKTLEPFKQQFTKYLKMHLKLKNSYYVLYFAERDTL